MFNFVCFRPAACWIHKLLSPYKLFHRIIPYSSSVILHPSSRVWRAFLRQMLLILPVIIVVYFLLVLLHPFKDGKISTPHSIWSVGTPFIRTIVKTVFASVLNFFSENVAILGETNVWIPCSAIYKVFTGHLRCNQLCSSSRNLTPSISFSAPFPGLKEFQSSQMAIFSAVDMTGSGTDTFSTCTSFSPFTSEPHKQLLLAACLV